MSGQIIRSDEALATATIRRLAARISDLYRLPDGAAAEIAAQLTNRLNRYEGSGGIRQFRIEALAVLDMIECNRTQN